MTGAVFYQPSYRSTVTSYDGAQFVEDIFNFFIIKPEFELCRNMTLIHEFQFALRSDPSILSRLLIPLQSCDLVECLTHSRRRHFHKPHYY